VDKQNLGIHLVTAFTGDPSGERVRRRQQAGPRRAELARRPAGTGARRGGV